MFDHVFHIPQITKFLKIAVVGLLHPSFFCVPPPPHFVSADGFSKGCPNRVISSGQMTSIEGRPNDVIPQAQITSLRLENRGCNLGGGQNIFHPKLRVRSPGFGPLAVTTYCPHPIQLYMDTIALKHAAIVLAEVT